VVPLPKVLLPLDGKGINKVYANIIIENEIPVLCVNNVIKKERLMPFKLLYHNNENFWRQGGDWEYYLTKESFDKLREKTIEKTGFWEFDPPPPKKEAPVKAAPVTEAIEELEELEVEVGYGKDYKKFLEMPVEKKIERLNNGKKRLNDLIIQKAKDVDVIMKALVETTNDAATINHVLLEEAIQLGDDEARKFTQEMVDSTSEMIKSSSQLLTEDFFDDALLTDLVKKSNGTIVQHMTRVYLNGVAFLAYYNNLVTTSSTIQRLRLSFVSKYRSFYHELLPHIDIDDIVLERAFLGGMRAIPPDLFFKWAVGFLIHDIGKAAAVEYHEGEGSYNREIVIEHVKLGYQNIVKKTNYPMEASVITGYHHEYYGSSDGYGYFRAYLQQYKKHNPEAKQDYCITFELEPVLDYQALGYFPAKVLEIIDVYDSVTDPHRVYRKALSSEEAIKMMREEFIEKHQKIDIILFDIFASFIKEKEKKKKR